MATKTAKPPSAQLAAALAAEPEEESINPAHMRRSIQRILDAERRLAQAKADLRQAIAEEWDRWFGSPRKEV